MRSRGRVAVSVLGLICLLPACSSAFKLERAKERVTLAEAEMKACQERNGLAVMPLPTRGNLYDPAKGPVAQDPAQLRLKALCGGELQEVLDARRSLRELR